MITKYNQNPDETKNINIPGVREDLGLIEDLVLPEYVRGNITFDQFSKISNLVQDMGQNLPKRSIFLNDANQMIDYIGTLVH